jgi:starch-binding outer membrane protein, SusD/RagB family
MKLLNTNYKMYLVKAAVLTLPLLTTVTSCKEDFLEAVPELALSDANAFDNPERILSQVNGLYSSAKSGSLFGGRYHIYNDIRAEEWINRTTNNVTGYGVYQGTQNSSDTYIGNFWSQGYLTINRINLFLDGLEKNSDKLSPELLANYRGEAKFLRALTYLGLVQLFAKPYVQDQGASPGLPLRLQPETSTANNDMPRSSVAEIYAQILKDLNEAEAELPDNYATASLRTVRAHKNSAIALKTRVHLIKGDYANVILEGNKIVSATAPFTSPNRVAHALQPSVVNVFRTPYTTTESIFSFAMAETNAPGTQNQIGYYFSVGNLEYYLNTQAPGIYANPQWGATDARRTQLTATHTLGRYTTKFSGVSPYIDFVPMIRYAEVLLNVAEAEAEVGSMARSLALLNAVHQRSDPSFTYVTVDKASLINTILTERRIELLAEGFRAPDLFRRNMPLPSVGAGGNIATTDQRYIFDIPVGETNVNPGI